MGRVVATRCERAGRPFALMTDAPDSLQLTQGFSHEPSVPMINIQPRRKGLALHTCAQLQHVPYATHTPTTDM